MGRGDIICALLDAGADVNGCSEDSLVTKNNPLYPKVTGFTALHAAAVKGNVDILKLLLSRGADIPAVKHESRIEEPGKKPPKDGFFTNKQEDLQKTALDVARRGTNTEAAVKYLEKQGAVRYCFQRH